MSRNSQIQALADTLIEDLQEIEVLDGCSLLVLNKTGEVVLQLSLSQGVFVEPFRSAEEVS